MSRSHGNRHGAVLLTLQALVHPHGLVIALSQKVLHNMSRLIFPGKCELRLWPIVRITHTKLFGISFHLQVGIDLDMSTVINGIYNRSRSSGVGGSRGDNGNVSCDLSAIAKCITLWDIDKGISITPKCTITPCSFNSSVNFNVAAGRIAGVEFFS